MNKWLHELLIIYSNRNTIIQTCKKYRIKLLHLSNYAFYNYFHAQNCLFYMIFYMLFFKIHFHKLIWLVRTICSKFFLIFFENLIVVMSQHTTKFQKNLISKNFRKLLIMLSDIIKYVRKFRSTFFNVEFSLKKQKFNFIAYENVLFEEEFLLKYFNNTFRFLIFVLFTVKITS